MSTQEGQPLRAFSLFPQLSTQLQTTIWKTAAAQHWANFQQHHPYYDRIWVIEVNHPYTTFHGRSLTDNELNAAMLFFPMLQTSQASRNVAREYVDLVYNRGQQARLVLKQTDKFIFEGEMIKLLINVSDLSNDFLKSTSLVKNWTNTFTFPGVIGRNLAHNVNVLSSVKHVVVPSCVFTDAHGSMLCRQFLLLIPTLEAVYVEHPNAPFTGFTGLLGIITDNSHHWEVLPNIRRMTKNYDGFLKLGHVHLGNFLLFFPSKDMFRPAYARKYDQFIDRSPTVPYTSRERQKLFSGSEEAWYAHQDWVDKHLADFLVFIQPFIEKGIDCIPVANVAIFDGFDFPRGRVRAV
ncbi:hypothetical protein F4821DRAFT_159601 [Hypoxylon rubiginosum]|uniref:Uncharacterized protein n=1 Tax=Hypoxylon rubiginosum TaxID=110542 RepID=A0ACC0DI34_9PEZI|nr:hypothetical protein F4821DRAFT_159601 [Hypoxylon rubiginosum]